MDIYTSDGKGRLYGFCALGKPNDLGALWFALESGVKPPDAVVVIIHDRKLDVKYLSNAVSTRPKQAKAIKN